MVLSIASNGAPPGLTPNGVNGTSNYSNGTSSYSTSPESTRSKGTASPSAHSAHLYMTNGVHSDRTRSKDTSALPRRGSEAQDDRAKRIPRAKTEIDLVKKAQQTQEHPQNLEQNWEVRHGWEDPQYNSNAILEFLSKVRISKGNAGA